MHARSEKNRNKIHCSVVNRRPAEGENPTGGKTGSPTARAKAHFTMAALRLGMFASFMLCGLVALGQPALSQGNVSAAEAAKQGLQRADLGIQKCLSVLNAITPSAELDSALKDILLRANQEQFEASAAMESLQKASSQSINLSAAELESCVAAYRTQSRLAPATMSVASDSYPNCGGERACPNPTSPGGICCGGDSVCGYQCGPRGTSCYTWCESKCFPSDATVQMEDGTTKAMLDLELGDRVQVVRPDGTVAYDDVYMMTHKDPAIEARYLKVALASGRSLTLSPRHFIPTDQAGGMTWGTRVLKGADELVAGDVVWYRDAGGAMSSSVVTAVEGVMVQGAFNPMTAAGTIVVDGVVASAHSDWFLDGIVSPQVQGQVYQAILSPVRAIYRVIGPQRMRTITEEWGVVDFVRDATSTPLQLAMFLMSLTLVLAALFFGARAVWRQAKAGARAAGARIGGKLLRADHKRAVNS